MYHTYIYNIYYMIQDLNLNNLKFNCLIQIASEITDLKVFVFNRYLHVFHLI